MRYVKIMQKKNERYVDYSPDRASVLYLSGKLKFDDQNGIGAIATGSIMLTSNKGVIDFRIGCSFSANDQNDAFFGNS